MQARIESLSLIETSIWLELQRACVERDHAWRLMTLATLDAGTAQARTVILREIDGRDLLFYTDARSAKVEQIAAHPLGTLLLWSPLLGWQLRLSVHLQIETSGLKVSSRWARLKLSPAAQDYLSPLPPGTPVAAKYAPERASRSHFAVVSASVRSIDWLELHADGHRRARFAADGATWLQP